MHARHQRYGTRHRLRLKMIPPAYYETSTGAWARVPRPEPLGPLLDQITHAALCNAMAWAHCNQTDAARALDVTRTAFLAKLRYYGIPRG